MSLHVRLSPEAQARLDAMRRNSTISSILVALITLFVIGLLLALISIKSLFMETPVIVSYSATEQKEEEVIATKKISTNTKQKPTAPSSAIARVIAAATTSNLAIPLPDEEMSQPSTDFGNGDDFEHGWGSIGDGGGDGGFGGLPDTMRKRCSKNERLQRLAQTGGNVQCEEAVLKALRWMKKSQNPDGSWNGLKKSAMTGLGILAYLGHCETPSSKEFGESCLMAMTYLINVGMQKQGKLADNIMDQNWCYEHAICVYALAEATIFCKELNITVPNLQEVTQKSGQFLIDNQHQSGGWDYGYSRSSPRGGDVSIVGWHLQALKAMKITGLEFNNLPHSIEKGLEFLEDKQHSNGGFGYFSKEHLEFQDYHHLTGVGTLCFQLWDKDAEKVRHGIKHIQQNSKLKFRTPNCNLYAHYYEAQAMMNFGGEAWKHYNRIMRDEVLKNQKPDGTWNSSQVPDDRPNFYDTALCTLMLEVYYRYLPGTATK